MLPLNDPRWSTLTGGYKTAYDPSGTLRQLEAGEAVWDELWQELHHQGDVGDASYATVPHLVRIAKSLPRRDWNFYGLVSTIEVERHRKSNPILPAWLVPDYKQALAGTLELAFADLPRETDRTTILSILGAIALAKGCLTLGAMISHCDEPQIIEVLDQSNAWTELYTECPL